MNTHEAYEILGISKNSSEEDIKKAFKKKAMEFHPDRNKEDGSEDKFKKVNEAYQLLNKIKTNPYEQSANPYGQPKVTFVDYDITNDFYNELQKQFNKDAHIKQNMMMYHTVAIPFDKYVTGDECKFKYNRVKAKPEFRNEAVCHKCNGAKFRHYPQLKKDLPCTQCSGTGKVFSYPPDGLSIEEEEISISRHSNNKIFKGLGNFNVESCDYENLLISIVCKPDVDMSLDGADVISIVNVSLLEALQGTKKKLRTVYGEKTLVLKPGIKNHDTVRVVGFGMKPHGNHVFLVKVNYPENTENLIKFLEEEQKQAEKEVEEIIPEGD
jgi:molecular chaperone DnaJ